MLLGRRARLVALVNDVTRKCPAIKVARACEKGRQDWADATTILSLGYRRRTAAVNPSTANSGTNARVVRYFTISRKPKRPLRCIASTATPNVRIRRSVTGAPLRLQLFQICHLTRRQTCNSFTLRQVQNIRQVSLVDGIERVEVRCQCLNIH